MDKIALTLIMFGVLGIAFKTMQKIIGLQKSFENANQAFNWQKYWKGEAVAFAASFVFIIILAMLREEILGYFPSAAKIIKTLFVCLRWIGADFGFAALGKAKRHIEAVIDTKTNIADKKPDLTAGGS